MLCLSRNVTLAFLLLTAVGFAQGSKETAVELMPSDAVGSVTVWPRAILSDKSLELSPVEVISASAQEMWGVELLDVERADWFYLMPGPDGEEVGGVFQLREPARLADLERKYFRGAPREVGGVLLYRLRSLPPAMHVHQLDERTILFGYPGAITKMLKREGNERLGNLLLGLDSGQDAVVLVDLASLRPLLQPALQAGMLPFPGDILEAVKGLVEKVEFVAVRGLLDNGGMLQLVATTESANSATTASAELEQTLDFAKQMILEQTLRGLPMDDAISQAMTAYSQRLATKIRTWLQPETRGNRIVMEVNNLQDHLGVSTLAGFLLPAIQSSRVAAQRMQSSNNLKQIGLALHNFESAYRKLPSTAAKGDDGQPMLSWRVAILPFVEEAELYQKFNLDEPWDSEHNLALLEEMPEVFRHPDFDVPVGKTVYQAVAGKDTLLQADSSRFRDVLDGLSNTVMAVQVAPENAVPWTAPQDFPVDEGDFQALFVDGVGNFLFGDGSVQSFPAEIDEDMLKAMFTRAGGEVIQR